MYNRNAAMLAKELIEKNYASPAFNVKALAAMVHFHEAYVRKLFHSNFGISPNAMLKEVRMSEAQKLLATTKMSVLQVAEAVGIPDASYFCKCYKKRFGYPPSQHKRMLH